MRFRRRGAGRTLLSGALDGLRAVGIDKAHLFDNQRMTILYGIPNCDTVKKARDWLAKQGVAYEFHDFKKQGVPADRLQAWIGAAGWERVLNRKGTTWRQLDAQRQAAVVDAASARSLMCAEPSTIKRPVVEWDDGRITVGFDAEAWAAAR